MRLAVQALIVIDSGANGYVDVQCLVSFLKRMLYYDGSFIQAVAIASGVSVLDDVRMAEYTVIASDSDSWEWRCWCGCGCVVVSFSYESPSK